MAKVATVITKLFEDMENAGANYQDDEVYVCQNQLVMSCTPDDLPAFNQELLKLLNK
ncbi:DJ-1/PfpI family protein [Viridibacillus soli]